MQDINLYQLLKFYAKKWRLILSVTLVGLFFGVIYSNFIQTPMYKSEATLLLIRSNGSADSTSQDTVLLNNYVELFKSRRVLESVIKKQSLKISYDDMAGSVEASNSKSTEVIKVAVSTDNSDKSKSFLDGAVNSFKAEVKQLYKVDNIKVVDSPDLQTKPYNINKLATTFLFTIASLLIVIITLFFIYDYRLLHKTKTMRAPDVPDHDDIEQNNMFIQQAQAEPIQSAETFAPIVPELPIFQSPTVTKPVPTHPTTNFTSTICDNARRTRERLIQTSYTRDRYRGRR